MIWSRIMQISEGVILLGRSAQFLASYHTQSHSIIYKCLSEAGKGQKLAKCLAVYLQIACA